MDPPAGGGHSPHDRPERRNGRRAPLRRRHERAVVDRDDRACPRGSDVVRAVDRVGTWERPRERGAAPAPRAHRDAGRDDDPLRAIGELTRAGAPAEHVRTRFDALEPPQTGQHGLDEPPDTGTGADERRGVDGDPHERRRYRRPPALTRVHGALDGGPVVIVVPFDTVISSVRSGSSFSFQPLSWTKLWCRAHTGSRLSRSVGPPCSHHHT